MILYYVAIMYGEYWYITSRKVVYESTCYFSVNIHQLNTYICANVISYYEILFFKGIQHDSQLFVVISFGYRTCWLLVSKGLKGFIF